MLYRLKLNQVCIPGVHLCAVLCLVAQSCPALCDHMDCSPAALLSVGILQARILEWVVMPASQGSSQPGIEPRSPALQVDSLPSETPGKPWDETTRGTLCIFLFHIL